MSVLLLRVVERIHGHLGWLTVVALLHPAILLRNPRRRARLSVVLATSLAVATALLGATVYPEYRARLKQHIFIEAPRIGWLFERKEHLAVGAVSLAVAGCLAHLSAPLFDDEGTRATVARLAHRAFVAAFVLGVLVGLLGMAVASYKSF
ncbi:MAG: hypothetical protein ACRELB_06160 [Polyangiaceae bacterium]